MIARFALAWLLAGSTFSYAQESRGAILGRVTDPSGSPIAGAAVKATNPETGITLTAAANSEGNYFLALPRPRQVCRLRRTRRLQEADPE